MAGLPSLDDIVPQALSLDDIVPPAAPKPKLGDYGSDLNSAAKTGYAPPGPAPSPGIVDTIKAAPRQIGGALGASVFDLTSGIYGVGRAVVDNLNDDAVARTIKASGGRTLLDPIADWLKERQDEGTGIATRVAGEDPTGFVANSLKQGVRSIPQSAAALGFAVMGMPEVGLGLLSAQTGGAAYGQARDAGKDPATAALFATSQGVIEYATEKLPVMKYLEDTHVGTSLGRKLFNNIAEEMIGEQAATALQDFNEFAVLHPEQSILDYIKARPAAAASTAIAVMVGSSATVLATHGGEKLIDRLNRAPASDQTIDGQFTDVTPPAPPKGDIESAVEAASTPTPEDEASPIPTAFITAGRATAARGQAEAAVNTGLSGAGLPNVGNRVSVDMGDGRTATGTMGDTFTHEDPDFGAAQGIRIALDDGTSFEEFLHTIQNGGISISDLGLPGAPEAATTGQDVTEPVAAPVSAAPANQPASSTARTAAKIIGVESGGDANARNPGAGQTASGLGQFTDATWLSLYKQKIGANGKSDAEILALKSDPGIGRHMTELAVDAGKASLKAAGLPVNDANVYLQHFLGPTANKLLAADPSTPVADVLPASWIAANQSVLGGKTVGDVVAWASAKMGGSSTAPSAAPLDIAADEPAAPTESAIDQVSRLTGEDLLGDKQADAAPAATVEKLTDKSVIVRNPSPAELDAIKAALPPAVVPLLNARENGYVFSAKHADKIGAALASAAGSVNNAPAGDLPPEASTPAPGPSPSPAARATPATADTQLDWDSRERGDRAKILSSTKMVSADMALKIAGASFDELAPDLKDAVGKAMRGETPSPSPKRPTIQQIADASDGRVQVIGVGGDKGGQASVDRVAEQARTATSKQDALKTALKGDGWPVDQPIRNLSRDDGRFAVRGGAVLETQTGRKMSPAPKFNDATPQTRKRSLNEQEKWLRDEAINEAEADRFRPAANALPFLRSMTPGNMSMADHGTINDVLFGDYNGPKDAASWKTDSPPRKPVRERPARDVGKDAFSAGDGRVPPADFNSVQKANWLQGWDAANLAAPVDSTSAPEASPNPRSDNGGSSVPKSAERQTAEPAGAATNSDSLAGSIGSTVSADEQKAAKRTEPVEADQQAASTPPSDKPAYGADNKLVSRDRAEELRKRLKAKMNQLNSGIDPEALALFTELGVYHIEAGARRFADFAKAITADLGVSLAKARPFLRSAYNGARDMMEDHDIGVAGMDSPDQVRIEMAALFRQETERGLQGDVPASDAGAGAQDVQRATGDRGTEQAGATQERGGAQDVRGSDGGSAETAQRPAARSEDASRGGGERAVNADRLPGGEPTDGRGRGADTATRAADRVTGTNWTIAPGSLDEARGAALKARDNIRAIEIVKALDDSGRPATREEQAALAKYVGWGGLKNAFAEGDPVKGFEKIAPRVRELLTDEEFEQARRSVQYAHYTSEKIVRPMWDAVRRLGFEGGKVFEPGMGTGNFAGMMPADLASKSQYSGIEYDRTTARIAALLYPQHGVQHADYTRLPMPRDAYDLVIGNPPFSETVIRSDPAYKDQGFVLHDYFFAKSLDAVRPGGLMMFVTSAGTMNKVGTKAREYLAERADLVGAIRLPGNAFEENAGTSVTTDIVVLRKRIPGEQAGDDSWTGTVSRVLPNREGGTTTGPVSAYFSAHPEMVLGTEGYFDKLVAGERYAVRAKPGTDISAELAGAMARLPAGVMQPFVSDAGAHDFDLAQSTTERKEGSFYLHGDRLMQHRGGVGVEVQGRGKGVEGGIPAKDQEKIRDLVPIRDALREVYGHDLAGNAKQADTARAALNKFYDGFVAKHGPINKAEISYRRPSVVQQESARAKAREEIRLAGGFFDEGSFDPTDMISNKATLAQVASARKAARETATALGREFDEGSFDPADIPDTVIDKRPNIDPFMDDQEGYRLRAIEHYNDDTGEAKKGNVFFENVITKERVPEIRGAGDALLYVLNKTGRVDLEEIASRAGMSQDQVLDEIGNAIFRDPAAGWQTREQYLSGNVRKKLVLAQATAERDASYQRNVDALQAAQPVDLSPAEIAANLGMPWIPTEVVEAFGKSLGLSSLRATYHGGIASWSVAGDTQSAASTATWGTSDRNAVLLLGDALNRTDPKIYKTVYAADGSKKQELNIEATQAAQDKVRALKDKFSEWVWADEARADDLAKLYNRDYNNLVAPEYDGGYLTTPGISSTWSWRPHQTRVIARIIQTGNTYMAHSVGAGKTSAMIGAGMEMRRLGLVRKPMYVVPNHMLGQFTKEFYEQYPTARIAVADEKRFHTDRRKQFIANVAADDLDAVIITHSSFGFIPLSTEFMDGMISKQVDDYRAMLAETKASGQGDRFTVRRIEQSIESMEQKLSGRASGKKDQVFTFEEMGTDFLFVDEAHLFRKLDFATKMGSVRGVDPNGSQASYDLFAKTRYLETRNPGRSHVLASGTPITNTMAELFSLSRYLQPTALAERGIDQFDSWAGAYGDTVTALEQGPDGGYKAQTRFAKFVNVPELSAMVRQIMDVVTSKQLEKYVTRPKIKGGARQLIVAEQSEAQSDFQAKLAERMRAIEARKGPPAKGDDIMLSVIGDGRKSAIDMRLIDPNMVAANIPSKVDTMIENVAKIAAASKRQPFHRPGADGYSEKPVDYGPAAQMIFSDLGINGEFPIHRYIANQLASMGIPRSQIAVISDYKNTVARQRLFNDMNEGKVRVLIGSVAKMGTGVNAQRRLLAVHNLDPQWYPANDEQRNGRILRQGNMNPEIQILDYSTKGTYDSQMWSLMGKKARFIEGFMMGDPTVRDMEDLGEASQYEQAQAITTNDPRILELTEYRQDLEKAERRKAAFSREQYAIKRRISEAEDTIAAREERIPLIEADIAQRTDIAGEAFSAKVGDKTFDERAAFGEAVQARMDELVGNGVSVRDQPVAEIAGFKLVADVNRLEGRYSAQLFLNRNGDRQVAVASGSATGIVSSVRSVVGKFDGELEGARDTIARSQQEVKEFTPQLGKKFEGQSEIERLTDRVGRLEGELAADAKAAAEVKPKAKVKAAEAPNTGDAITDWKSAEGKAAIAAAHKALTAQLEEMGISDRITLKVAGRLFDPEGNEANGLYWPGQRIIEIALDAGGETGSLDHEAIHALKDMGLFLPDEWRALERAAQADAPLMKTIRDAYGPLGLTEPEMVEEAVAEMYRTYRAEDRKLGKFVTNALDRIGSLLNGLRSLVTGKAGGVAARVMRSIATGEVGRRTAPGDKAPAKPKASLRGVPGIMGEQESNGDESAGAMVDGFWNSTKPGAFQAAYDRWRVGLQDRMLPLLRIQTTVEMALGRPLTEAENPYLGEETLSGKVGAQLERLERDHVEPLFEDLRDSKITVDELEDYLYARHAEERNARIASINPEFAEDEGSGMTNAEAQTILDAVENDPRQKDFERISKRVYAILRGAMKVRVAGGLLSKEDAIAINGTYKNYVPLRGRAEIGPDDLPSGPMRSSGISVRGAETRRAFGRKSKASDILAHSIMQAEEALSRAETNRVARQFYDMARAAPDPGFWKVDKIERRAVWNKQRGQVEYQSQRRVSAEDKDFTVSLKIDGDEHRVTLNRNNPTAVRVATAMRNLNAQQTQAWVRYVGASTRMFSKVNTSLNPEFLITNAFRDIQAAGVNLLQHDVKGLVRGTIRDWRKALVANSQNEGEWGNWRREFELAGGKVYFTDRTDLRSLRSKIDREMAKANGVSVREAVSTFFDTIEKANNRVENAVRLAAFKNARTGGMTPAQAASVARNVTVNFTRRGQFGPVINSLYAFFNAGVQGSATLAIAAGRSKKVRLALAAAVVLGLALDNLNRWLADDDDDGESLWSKVPDYEKEKNLILFIPGEGKHYIKIPTALGLNAFTSLGRNISEVAHGRSAIEAAGEAAAVGIDAFNPIGGGGSILNLLAPTFADPIVDMSTNRNFAGKPIRPELSPFDKSPKPESERYFPNVTAASKMMAHGLNLATGGDDVVPGMVSISPELMDYTAAYFAGGAGRFVGQLGGLAAAPFDPDAQMSIADIPFARKLVGDKPEWYDRTLFYDRVRAIEEVAGRGKDYQDTGRREALSAYIDKHAVEVSLIPLAEEARKVMAKDRKATKLIEGSNLSPADKKSRSDALAERDDNVVRNFDALWNATLKARGEAQR